MMRLPALVVAIACCVAAPASGAERPGAAAPTPRTVVLLPLDNCSGIEAAQPQIAAMLTSALQERGWTVVDGEQVRAILEAERVRYLDALEPQVVHKIVEATGASAIVIGTIYSFSESRNSTVAIAARMIHPDGRVAWANLAAMSSDDTERILGFGRKTATSDVARAAVNALTESLPQPEQEASIARGPSKPLFRSGPASFRAQELDAARPQRVCVLPFDNLSANPDAARVVADVLALRLAAAGGFEVIDPAMLRASALETRVGSFRDIDTDALVKLARAVGTTLFLRGTIYEYTDPSTRFGGEPELQLEWSLVDVSTGRVLWAAQHARKGRDYIGFLMRGNVASSVALADHVIGEMVRDEAKAKHHESRTAAIRANTKVAGEVKK